MDCFIQKKEKRMDTSIFTFSIQKLSAGWLTTVISDGTQEVTLVASYLSDALSDLLNVILALLEGADEGACAWMQEPGEFHWLFKRKEEKILLRLVWFDDNLYDDFPKEAGRILLLTECDLTSIATEFYNALTHLLDTVGIEGYKKHWDLYEFPHRTYKELGEHIVGLKGSLPLGKKG
jgi:hypothetical protein